MISQPHNNSKIYTFLMNLNNVLAKVLKFFIEKILNKKSSLNETLKLSQISALYKIIGFNV